MKAFVIAIIGLPHSERGAETCIASAKQYDLNVELFPATTRYETEAALRDEGLTLNRRIYERISDDPIGDRDKTEPGRWHLTTPEIGCFLSHYGLWKRSVMLNEPVMVFEHDARLIAPPPALFPTILALSFNSSAYGGAAGYIISPAGARIMIREAGENGIQPADEMLWRTALHRRQLAFCDPPVIVNDDGGVSTIQFTRNDLVHAAIQKSDPWNDYVPPQNQTSDRKPE